MKKTLLFLLPVLFMPACLVKETRHTLYLEPDGGVTWSVMETDIHSDSARLEDRSSEETQFLETAGTPEYTITRALAALGPVRLDSRLLRADRPYSVLTEARFTSLDDLARSFLARVGVPGQTWLDVTPGQVHWEMTCFPDQEQEVHPKDGEDMLALLGSGAESYHLVLTHGHFTAAQGFRLDGDNRTAIPIEQDSSKQTENGTVTLSLTWTTSDSDN